MKPALQETDALVPRLRTQLILAQVRIMELEDVRDSLAASLQETEKLLNAAQSLADGKVEEAAHLARVQTDLQAQFIHMRHMQHITQLALDETRGALESAQRMLGIQTDELAALRTALIVEQQEAVKRRGEISALSASIAAREAQLKSTTDELTSALNNLEALRHESAQRLGRISQLDAERCVMKTSRSWRWTAWIRSIERLLQP